MGHSDKKHSKMKNCIHCKNEFTPKRKDAKFCSIRCKNQHHRAKSKEITPEILAPEVEVIEPNEVSQNMGQIESVPKMGQQSSLLQQKNEALESDIKSDQKKVDSIHRLIAQIPIQINQIEQQIQVKNSEILNCEDVLKTDDIELYNSLLNTKYQEELSNGFSLPFYKLTYLSPLVDEYQEIQGFKAGITYEINDSKRFINDYFSQLKRLETDQKRLEDILKSVHTRIEAKNKRLLELDKLLFKEEKKSVTQTVKPSPKQKGTIGAADLLNMEFETFQIEGELGRFLGELDRNMTAIALTGDSGAGKSYFSFQLAKAFANEGMSVKYFSLEEGIGRLTQQKIIKYSIGNEIALTGEGSLSDVRRDAKLYDVIVVDSFSKLNAKAPDFEKLRNDFPKTIFIFIFQKTTSGAIRGGSSILFNSSATIDVHFKDNVRVATMKKSRYGTIGWVYDIEGDRMNTI